MGTLIKNGVIYSNGSSNNEMISDAWDASTTYKIGDYAIYNNSLWKCLVQNSNTPPAEGATWTRTQIADEFGKSEDITNQITILSNSIYDLDSLSVIKVGKIVTASFRLKSKSGSVGQAWTPVLSNLPLSKKYVYKTVCGYHKDNFGLLGVASVGKSENTDEIQARFATANAYYYVDLTYIAE